MNNKNNEQDPRRNKKFIKRKEEDQALIQKLLYGPNAFLTEKGTDEHLDKLSLRFKLLNGKDFSLADYVSTLIAVYESKFKKKWFYKLADIYGDPHNVMDEWVKPDYVRQTIVEFVYGRFPYSVLRMLRKNKRKYGTSDNKLYHLLTPKASDDLDIVIQEVYDVMNECENNNPSAFKMAYSSKHKVYFQTEINF